MAGEAAPPRYLRTLAFAAFGLSGASALTFEIVWTRALSTVMGSSTYALSTMLAAFMGGLSLGGALGGFVSARTRDPLRAFAICELGIGIVGIAVAPLVRNLTPLYISSYYAFHESFTAFYAVQFVIAFVLMGVPTTLMGATFPLVIRLFSEWKGEPGLEAGRLYAVNTLGGIFGSLAAGFLLVPLVGVTHTATIASALNVLNALALLAARRLKRESAAAAAVALTTALVATQLGDQTAPTFSYGYAGRFGNEAFARRVASAGREQQPVFHHEGADGDVWLLRNGKDYTLVNGSKLEGGETDSFALLARLPWLTANLLRPPRNALNIGLGSGNSLSVLAQAPLEHIDSVEISAGILEANRQFIHPELFSDPRITHVRADGRNHLLVHRESYDLIVVSPSWAVEEASAALLTREFFAVAAHHLSPDGAIGVWVDFSFTSDDDMRRVLHAFAENFRHVTAWHVGADVVLVGSNTTSPFPPEDEVLRLAEASTPTSKGKFRVGLSDTAPRPASFADAYSDDLPVVEFNNARNSLVGAVARQQR